MGKQKIAGKFQEAFKNTLFRENVKLILCAGEKKKKKPSYILRHSGKAPKEFLFYLNKELKGRKEMFYIIFTVTISVMRTMLKVSKENTSGSRIVNREFLRKRKSF